MEASSSSSKSSEWDLVLDHDWGPGSTIGSLVPLSAIQESAAGGSNSSPNTLVTVSSTASHKDKSHTVIVLQQNSGNLISESISRNLDSCDDCDEETTENIAAFISLSDPHQEDPENSLPGTVIHIQDPGLASNISDTNSFKTLDTYRKEDASKLSFNSNSDQAKEGLECNKICMNSTSTDKNINTNHYHSIENSDSNKGVIKNSDGINGGKWHHAAYLDAIKDLTEDLKLSDKGMTEPFSKVSVTLCKGSVYAGDLMRRGGLLDSLQQQGLATTLCVKDTGPKNWVLTGTLVELLALRALAVRALAQAEECVGKTYDKSMSTAEKRTYSEIGVMCQLIPSPKGEKLTASTSHDLSTKRLRSELSQPLTPVTRRKKTRKHLLHKNNVKNKSALFNVLEEGTKKNYSRSSVEELEQESKDNKVSDVLPNKFLEQYLDYNISLQELHKKPDSKHDKSVTHLVKQNPSSVLVDTPIVEVILSQLKSEPDCDDNVISETVVSDSSLLGNFVNDNENCLPSGSHNQKTMELDMCVGAKSKTSLDSWTSTKSNVDQFDDQLEEKLRQMDEICFPQSSSHKSYTEVASNKENIQNLNLLESDVSESNNGNHEQSLKEGDEINDNDNICQLEMTVSDDHNELDNRKIKVSQGSRQIDEAKFKFSCRICSFKSTRENHYIKHMKLHDKGIALYKCTECNFVSIRASHLRRHKMTHAQQVLRCNLCNYNCDDQKLLTKHIRVKHESTTKQPSSLVKDDASLATSSSVYECSECDYKTSWQYAFQRHSRTHHNSKMDIIHTCPDCPYKTVRREHFLRHIKNVHQNHRPFLCDVCGKAFKRQDALKQHHVTHYPNFGDGSSSTYGYVCHICQKVCRSTAYLKEHMATHSEERSFLCEICGACFKTRSVQRNHVQTIHRKPRAFTCLQCDKKFNTKFALRRHMKQHETNHDDKSEGNKPEMIHTTSRMRDVHQIVMDKPNKSITDNTNRNITSTKVLTHRNSMTKSVTMNPSTTLSSALSATISSSYSRGTIQSKASCGLPPPSSIMTEVSQQHHQQSQNSNSGSSTAYQITIDGQPAYLLPIKEEEGGTSTSHHTVAAAVSRDTGGLVVHGGTNHTALCDGGITSEGQIKLATADTLATHSQLIPMMPHTATVHIVNSQTERVSTSSTDTPDTVIQAAISASSEAVINGTTTSETVILRPDNYDTQRTNDETTATYVTEHSNNTTILYLTNFT